MKKTWSMSERHYRLFLEDIALSIEKIEAYTKDVPSLEEFSARSMVVDAVLKNLEVIGEAARRIPDSVKEKYPDIPWNRVVGLRNVIVHGYFAVDLAIIWKIIKEQLPELKRKIEVIRNLPNP